MDFDRIKGAVEGIELPREARERMLSAGADGRRKPKLVFNLGPRLVLIGICLVIIAGFWLAPKPEDKIVINAYPKVEYTKRYWDAENYEEQVWDWEQTVAYFGRNVLPDPVPEGMTLLNEMNYNAVAVHKNTGEIVYDNQRYTYWSDYTEAYYPELDRTVKNQTGDGYGFSLTVSRRESGSDVILIWPDEAEDSVINGTVVMIGGLVPESPDQYLLYDAEFLYDDVYYQLRTFDMDQDQLVALLYSLMHE